MKFASIDIETTGLDRKAGHGIIEFACVLDDTKNWYDEKKDGVDPRSYLPLFHCYIINPKRKWAPDLLANEKYQAHKDMAKRIADRTPGYDYFTPEEMVQEFAKFLFKNGYKISNSQRAKGKIKINPCGKNFGSFDQQWLEDVPGWTDMIKLDPRSIDPGVLYWTPTKDQVVPNAQKTFNLAGFDHEVMHTALDDAFYTLMAVREKYLNQPYLTAPQTLKNVIDYLTYVSSSSHLLTEKQVDKVDAAIVQLKK